MRWLTNSISIKLKQDLSLRHRWGRSFCRLNYFSAFEGLPVLFAVAGFFSRDGWSRVSRSWEEVETDAEEKFVRRRFDAKRLGDVNDDVDAERRRNVVELFASGQDGRPLQPPCLSRHQLHQRTDQQNEPLWGETRVPNNRWESILLNFSVAFTTVR